MPVHGEVLWQLWNDLVDPGPKMSRAMCHLGHIFGNICMTISYLRLLGSLQRFTGSVWVASSSPDGVGGILFRVKKIISTHHCSVMY